MKRVGVFTPIFTTKTMSNFNVTLAAGPLWNDEDAATKGPRIAAAHLGKFTGTWNTVVPSVMSVVQVSETTPQTGKYSFKTLQLAGPLWNDEDAKAVAPNIAASWGGTWTGVWKTITEGVMSVIEVEYSYS